MAKAKGENTPEKREPARKRSDAEVAEAEMAEILFRASQQPQPQYVHDRLARYRIVPAPAPSNKSTPTASMMPQQQAPIIKKPVKKSSGRPPSQIERAIRAIEKLSHQGVVVSHGMTIAAVKRKVDRELEPESKRLGLDNPDVTTIARALRALGLR